MTKIPFIKNRFKNIKLLLHYLSLFFILVNVFIYAFALLAKRVSPTIKTDLNHYGREAHSPVKLFKFNNCNEPYHPYLY